MARVITPALKRAGFSADDIVAFDRDIATGEAIVMKPSRFRRDYRTRKHLVWIAVGGFGLRRCTSGRAVYARSVSDGETCRFNREDVAGIYAGHKFWFVEGGRS